MGPAPLHAVSSKFDRKFSVEIFSHGKGEAGNSTIFLEMI